MATRAARRGIAAGIELAELTFAGDHAETDNGRGNVLELVPGAVGGGADSSADRLAVDIAHGRHREAAFEQGVAKRPDARAAADPGFGRIRRRGDDALHALEAEQRRAVGVCQWH